MLVEVTQEDIEVGRPRKAQACPVWWAIRRSLQDPYALGIYVGQKNLEVASRKTNYARRKVRWPAGVRPRIRKYDLTGEMAPFSFTLPDTVRALVAP